ncbi:MAG: hypothetical protein JST06_04715 [Bacteroidetes bacterium]|nr:hypothetical protein [Bacteroidota bacterium]
MFIKTENSNKVLWRIKIAAGMKAAFGAKMDSLLLAYRAGMPYQIIAQKKPPRIGGGI